MYGSSVVYDCYHTGPVCMCTDVSRFVCVRAVYKCMQAEGYVQNRVKHSTYMHNIPYSPFVPDRPVHANTILISIETPSHAPIAV